MARRLLAPRKSKEKAQAAEAPAPKEPDGTAAEFKGQVKYTYPKKPPRTYVQAMRGGKWEHVITVTEMQHADHKNIVWNLGEKVKHGELSIEKAKEVRAETVAGWRQ